MKTVVKVIFNIMLREKLSRCAILSHVESKIKNSESANFMDFFFSNAMRRVLTDISIIVTHYKYRLVHYHNDAGLHRSGYFVFTRTG